MLKSYYFHGKKHKFGWGHFQLYHPLETFDKFVDICKKRNIKAIIVRFDDCQRPYPKLGKQPLPVKGVHNSGWKQSPGMELVNQVDEEKIDAKRITQEKKT